MDCLLKKEAKKKIKNKKNPSISEYRLLNVFENQVGMS